MIMVYILFDTNTAETRTTETKHQPPLYREFDQEQLGCVTISALCWIFHSTRSNVPSIDVVMPIESDGVADAHEVCARLGGVLKTPDDKQDMQRVLDLVSAHIDKSDCSTGIWVPYEINQEDKWALTDGSEETLTPDHFNRPKWLGWSLGQPNGQGTDEIPYYERCAAAELDKPELFDVGCNTVGYCYVCTFEVGKSRFSVHVLFFRT